MVWSAYQAILLELHHHMKRFRWVPRNIVWARIGTFLVVTIGWVFFRPPTWDASMTILRKMFVPAGFLEGVRIQPGLILILLIALGWAMLAPNMVELVRVRKAAPRPAWAVALSILTAACSLLLSQTGPFLYF